MLRCHSKAQLNKIKTKLDTILFLCYNYYIIRWSGQCRLDFEGNIENISDEVLECEIEEMEEEILDEYFLAYGNDELYKKYKETWNG